MVAIKLIPSCGSVHDRYGSLSLVYAKKAARVIHNGQSPCQWVKKVVPVELLWS